VHLGNRVVRLGDEPQHGLHAAHARHGHGLDEAIELGAVAAVPEDGGEDAASSRVERALAGPHPRAVAQQRADLAVVADAAEGHFIQPDGTVEGYEFSLQETEDPTAILGKRGSIHMTRVEGHVDADGSVAMGLRRVTSPIPMQWLQHALGTPGTSTRVTSERWVGGAREPEPTAAPLVERTAGTLRIAGISIPVHTA